MQKGHIECMCQTELMQLEYDQDDDLLYLNRIR